MIHNKHKEYKKKILGLNDEEINKLKIYIKNLKKR